MQEKVVKEKIFSVKPFSYVRIGDPMYFEQMQEGDKNKALRELTCTFEKIPKTNREAKVRIREIVSDFKDEGKPYCFTQYEMLFYTARKTPLASKIIEAELDGKYYPDLIKRESELGCDTARFEMTINENWDEIHTGADGFFGMLHHYKNNEAYVFSIMLDEDMTSWEEVEQYVQYFFDGVKNVA
jgi:hypothetical protein